MHTRKHAVLFAGAALLSLSGAVAMAQGYGPPPGPPPGDGYGQFYHEPPGRPMMGARMGWQAGFAQGQHDRDHGHSYRPTHTDQFRNVPESPEGYPRDRFKAEYRDAFIKGYQHGFGR